jgi:hypothetical protein
MGCEGMTLMGSSPLPPLCGVRNYGVSSAFSLYL